jgi:phage minor structural protein
MYSVIFRETPTASPLLVHAPFTGGLKLVSGSINQGINSIDSFDLEIDFTNAGYNHVKPMQTLVEVRNVKNNNVEFTGRVLNYSDNMANDGLHTKSVVCEGILGYLHDSYQPYIDFSGSPESLFNQLITNHNSQVEDYKQFIMGTVSLKTKVNKDGTVISVDDGIATKSTTCFITPEQTTFDQLKSNLLDIFGGEIQVRIVGTLQYIDYVQSVGHDSQEDIGISRNLRSVTKKVDPSSIVTRLIPLGKTISTTSTTDNERRVTIESVNNGKNYLERADLVSQFGIQYGSVTYDDVENPSVILQAGTDWLNQQKIVLEQFTVEALDLFKIGKGIEEYIVGNTHNIVNPIMTLNERIRVIGKTVDIVDPINSSLTIGDKFKTLIDYQMEQREASKNYNKLQNTITQQRATIDSLSTQLAAVQNTVTTSNVSTLPQDLQDINDQLDTIQQEVEALPAYALKKYTTTIGDDTSTEYTITHNIGSQDVIVRTRGTVAPYSEGQVMDIEYIDNNSIIIRTASPIPSNDKLNVTIIG